MNQMECAQLIAGPAKWWQRAVLAVSVAAFAVGTLSFAANQAIDLADRFSTEDGELVAMLRGLARKSSGRDLVIHITEARNEGFEWYRSNTVKVLQRAAALGGVADVLIPKSVVGGGGGLVVTAVKP